jgi:hypothetical protein
LREISMQNSFSGNYDVMRGKTHHSLKSPACSRASQSRCQLHQKRGSQHHVTD